MNPARVYRLPFFLIAIIAVVIPPSLAMIFSPDLSPTATTVLPSAHIMKWIYWLMIWMTLMVLPLFLDGSRDMHRPFFFGIIAAVILLFVFFMTKIPVAVMGGSLLLGMWQSYWWCASRGKTFRSPSFGLHTGLLMMGWIAGYYYVGTECEIAYSGTGAILSFILSAALVFLLIPIYSWRAARPSPDKARRGVFYRVLSRAITVAIIAAFVLESLRVDRLEPVKFFHHWGVYVGSLQQMRQGGWLLWDTPAQYGFLNMMFLWLLPFRSFWSSLYLANSFFIGLEGICLFFFLWRTWPTLQGSLAAFSLVFFPIYLLTGGMETGIGPSSMPSSGGFRFIWVVVTVAYLSLMDSKKTGSFLKSHGINVTVNAVFVVSMLWSAESFFYCGLAWLAFFWGKWLTENEPRVVIIKQIMSKVGSLLFVVALISVGYKVTFGHFPDWFMFVEYVFGFGTGFGSRPMKFPGPGLCFLYFPFILAVVLSGWVRTLRSSLGPILAAFSAFWGCATYYVVRGLPECAVDIVPVLLLAGVGIIHSVERFPNIKSHLLLWFSPLCFSLCLCIFLCKPLLPSYLKGLSHASFFNVERVIPPVSEETRTLLQHIPDIDMARIVSWQDNNLPGRMGDHLLENTWLPLAPLALAGPLRNERKGVFFQRRLSNLSGCGWILYGNYYPHTIGPISVFDMGFLNAQWRPRKYFKSGSSELVLWCKDGEEYPNDK